MTNIKVANWANVGGNPITKRNGGNYPAKEIMASKPAGNGEWTVEPVNLKINNISDFLYRALRICGKNIT